VSLRSKAKPINGVAQQFNGGGHDMASGAKAKNKKEIKEIVNKISNLK